MRALRDFNTPKIVTDDVQIFMGLIGDLFPALNVPRKRDLDFEQTVKQSVLVRTYKPTCTFTVPSNYFLHCFFVQDLGLQPEDGFILKIVQLEELRHVRHSIFVIGNAGTGKSKVQIYYYLHCNTSCCVESLR